MKKAKKKRKEKKNRRGASKLHKGETGRSVLAFRHPFDSLSTRIIPYTCLSVLARSVNKKKKIKKEKRNEKEKKEKEKEEEEEDDKK